MKNTLLIAFAVVTAAASANAQHDDCAMATAIAGAGSFPFTTLGTTDSGMIGSCNDPAFPSADGWFAWTPATSGNYLLTVCGTSDFDTVMALYDGCGGLELGCDDAGGCAGGLNDVEIFAAGLMGGTTYLIQLDGWQQATGSGTLDIAGPIVAPSNDDCAAATPIAGNGTFPFSTIGATDSGMIGSCNLAGGASADIWFEWTSGMSTDYQFQVCGAFYDVMIGLFDACSGTELACDDQFASCGGTVNDVEINVFGLMPNTTYLVQIDGWDGATGMGSLLINDMPPPPPANDNCANATPIASTGSFPFDTTNATPEYTSSCNAVANSADIWFAWTTGAATDYNLKICNGTYDVMIAVLDTCGGTELACDDQDGCGNGTLNDVEVDLFGLTPNTTYLIQVDGWAGAMGQGTLDISTLGGPANIGTNYCFTLPNSTGGLASMSAVGSESVMAQALSLQATSLPPNVVGIFYYGTSTVTVPGFGDGVRCVGGAVQRLPFNMADGSGILSELDVYALPMPNLAITPTALNFQAWFRDPAGPGGTGFNTSDGLTIQFVP